MEASEETAAAPTAAEEESAPEEATLEEEAAASVSMASVEVDDKTDYDEVTLNPLIAEIEAEAASELDAKNKPRRYWTPKEEERFFEIWGRENWRLTRHGKNTVYFAQWSDELMERFGVDVKPEEVQAKVNQTRAKFRQVKKQLEADDKATRWKKYDIIDKILNNQYRPDDAEPLPPDALENNRDITPPSAAGGFSSSATTTPTAVRQPTPTSSTSNSMPETASAVATSLSTLNHAEAGVAIEPQITVDPNVVNVALEHNLSAGLFNTATDGDSRANYSTELFSDQIDIVKQEEFVDEYNEFQYQQPSVPQPTAEQNHYAAAPPEQPQLHQLQTPQQQQQQQQLQQNQQHQYQAQQQQYTTPPPAVSPVAAAAHQQPFAYDHSTNSYANQNQNRTLVLNSQNHYGSTLPSAGTTTNQYSSNNYTNNNSNTNNTSSMQPPRHSLALTHPAPQARKRTRGPAQNTLAALTSAAPAPDSVEAQYLEEVRKKNQILEEQKNISAKRLVLEERKITLMEEFFPKCLALQEQIMQRLNST